MELDDISHYYAVIMAGGGGTRLWPLSRQGNPKQMLQLLEKRSLFQIAVDRLNGLFPYDRILVVTIEDQVQGLRAQCQAIPAENYIIEPLPRGTASVVGLAAIELEKRDPSAVMAILTADHIIQNESGFRSLLTAAHRVAQEGYLVTLGITPSYASTGYGYIQWGEGLDPAVEQPVHRVIKFKEKPDETTAAAMLASGDHVWNSGMFIWRVDQILAEISRQMPELNHGLAQITAAWNTAQKESVVEEVWNQLQPDTIDYGVMEGAERVAVILSADLGWSDVGSWDALDDVLPADENGNIVHGCELIDLDTRNTLAYNSAGHGLIVTIGVEDLVIVSTGDVLLVCQKDQAQRVRDVVKLLQHQGNAYL